MNEEPKKCLPGTRNATSREGWKNSNILTISNASKFTQQEDTLILESRAAGSSWRVIASLLSEGTFRHSGPNIRDRWRLLTCRDASPDDSHENDSKSDETFTDSHAEGVIAMDESYGERGRPEDASNGKSMSQSIEETAAVETATTKSSPPTAEPPKEFETATISSQEHANTAHAASAVAADIVFQSDTIPSIVWTEELSQSHPTTEFTGADDEMIINNRRDGATWTEISALLSVEAPRSYAQVRERYFTLISQAESIKPVEIALSHLNSVHPFQPILESESGGSDIDNSPVEAAQHQLNSMTPSYPLTAEYVSIESETSSSRVGPVRHRHVPKKRSASGTRAKTSRVSAFDESVELLPYTTRTGKVLQSQDSMTTRKSVKSTRGAGFTTVEDEIIIESRENGASWKNIADMISDGARNRSANDIKARWEALQRTHSEGRSEDEKWHNENVQHGQSASSMEATVSHAIAATKSIGNPLESGMITRNRRPNLDMAPPLFDNSGRMTTRKRKSSFEDSNVPQKSRKHVTPKSLYNEVSGDDEGAQFDNDEDLTKFITQSEFSAEEDKLILECYAEIGDNKWEEIASLISNGVYVHSGDSVRNRWHELQEEADYYREYSPQSHPLHTVQLPHAPIDFQEDMQSSKQFSGRRGRPPSKQATIAAATTPDPYATTSYFPSTIEMHRSHSHMGHMRHGINSPYYPPLPRRHPYANPPYGTPSFYDNYYTNPFYPPPLPMPGRGMPRRPIDRRMPMESPSLQTTLPQPSLPGISSVPMSRPLISSAFDDIPQASLETLSEHAPLQQHVQPQPSQAPYVPPTSTVENHTTTESIVLRAANSSNEQVSHETSQPAVVHGSSSSVNEIEADSPSADEVREIASPQEIDVAAYVEALSERVDAAAVIPAISMEKQSAATIGQNNDALRSLPSTTPATKTNVLLTPVPTSQFDITLETAQTSTTRSIALPAPALSSTDFTTSLPNSPQLASHQQCTSPLRSPVPAEAIAAVQSRRAYISHDAYFPSNYESDASFYGMRYPSYAPPRGHAPPRLPGYSGYNYPHSHSSYAHHLPRPPSNSSYSLGSRIPDPIAMDRRPPPGDRAPPRPNGQGIHPIDYARPDPHVFPRGSLPPFGLPHKQSPYHGYAPPRYARPDDSRTPRPPIPRSEPPPPRPPGEPYTQKYRHQLTPAWPQQPPSSAPSTTPLNPHVP